MPMYEIEWTETRKQRARVMVPNDTLALQMAAEKGPSGMPKIVSTAILDGVPIVAAGQTEFEVTELGRVYVSNSVDDPEVEVRPL